MRPSPRTPARKVLKVRQKNGTFKRTLCAPTRSEYYEGSPDRLRAKASANVEPQ